METTIRERNCITVYTDGLMGRHNDLPTITELDDMGKPRTKVWMVDECLSRTNGAAVVGLSGGLVVSVEFWVKGVQVDTEEVLLWLVSRGYSLDEALGLSHLGWEDRIRLQFIIKFGFVGSGVLKIH
jgi:hypothetical protein